MRGPSVPQSAKMPEDKPPLFAGLRHELGGLSSELRRWFRAHFELAWLEIQADLREVRRLIVALAAAAVLALAVLPLLATALAWRLKGSVGLGFGAWLALFGVGLLLLAVVGGLLAWRRFRRRYSGLEETLEELREDLVWLGEWTGRETAPDDGKGDTGREDGTPGDDMPAEGPAAGGTAVGGAAVEGTAGEPAR